MKIMRQQKWLHYLLVIAMFFSGMCFETVNTNSFSSYAENPKQACSFQLSKNTQTHQDICDSEQLRSSTLRSVIERLNRSFSFNKGKAKVRTGLFLSALNNHSENPYLYFNNSHIRVNYAFTFCKAVIISYIHHQDGAKG